MTEKKKYGVGIIGCGAISPVHATALNESKNAELVAVYSRNATRARKLGEKFDTSWYGNWNAFIYDERLEAVSICTPSGTHLDYGKLAAEAGKHVIVEKPIEVTVERGKELVEICEQNGVQLAVIFQNRFMQKTREMKSAIEKGELGKIFQGDAYIKWYRDQKYYDSGGWRGTLALDGGGALINQSIHTIDLLQWIMGDVDYLFGQTATFAHQRIEGEDTGLAVLRFKNGALGVIEAATSIYPAQSRRIEIHGTKGSAILDGDSLIIETSGPEKDKEKKVKESKTGGMGAASPFANFDVEPHRRQFEAIFEAIANRKTPPVSGEDALKSLAIVRAIYESSKTGRVVKIR